MQTNEVSLAEAKKLVALLWSNPVLLSKELDRLQFDLFSFSGVLETYFPGNFFLVNSFPLPIREEVMGELEIYFDHTRQGPITEQRFLQEEQRYVELFYRLWAKSTVTIYTNLHYKEIAYIKQPLTPNEINLLDQIIQKTKPKDLDDWYSFVDSNRLDEIDLLVRLTLRDKISTCFIFPSIKTVLWSNGLCYTVYLGDLSSANLLQLLCTTNGIYLNSNPQN